MSDQARGRGRPKIILDETLIARFIGQGFTVEYVASYFDVSQQTLYANYSDALRKGYVFREGCLQAKQFHEAMRGNTTLLIWLGKQWLKQTEKVEHTGSAGVVFSLGDQPQKPQSETKLLQ